MAADTKTPETTIVPPESIDPSDLTAEHHIETAKRPKRKRPKSRPQRWAEAAGEARAAFDDLTAAKDKLAEAFSTLNDLKSEYEEWRDNLPESLQGSAVGEKLEAICDMDFDTEVDLDEVENIVSAAEDADLPRGFGKD